MWKITDTVSPGLKEELEGTSWERSPKETPKGVRSATMPGRKPSCWERRFGGEGPGATSFPRAKAVANFLNSWMYADSVWGPNRVEAPCINGRHDKNSIMDVNDV